MTPRERVARTMAHKPVDRIPIYDQYWLDTQRTFRKGLGKELPAPPQDRPVDWGDQAEAAKQGTMWELFDLDIIEVGWPAFDLKLGFREVVEETDEWAILRDGHLSERKWWKHRQGTPEHVRYGINSPEKWNDVKQLLTPDPNRIRWDEFKPIYERAKRDNRFICYGTVEVIEIGKDVIGHEMMCRAMIKQPDWLHEVFDTYTRLQIDMFHMFEEAGYPCDGAFVYGDIAYKNGPFMSPRHYREFVQPYHKRLFDEFKKRDMPVMFHTDGDVRSLIPHFLESGISALNPLEAKANMDLRELAPEYGDRLGFIGNIDVMVIATNDRDLIREELKAKLAAAMPYRGYVYHSDHSIPPGVTLETYQWMLDEVRRLGRYD